MAKFKARARTVDMLGRQQIAGAATAISELFKNAHDAYAKRVEVDYYRPDKLFLLRDDGIGMTPGEFQDRWLTLGTESKVGGGTLPYRPPGTEERPIMGEKGIGRLAIARIGPQVLVMSRARRGKVVDDLVIGLVNWELFEIPGLDLDEIEIPVQTCREGKLPTVKIIESLKKQLSDSVRQLSGRMTPERGRRILSSIAKFTADPEQIDTFFSSGDAVADPGDSPLSLKGDGVGTHFLIQPSDDFLGDEIDRDQNSNDDPTFTKFLVGFANTMVPDAPPPSVRTRFRDWKYSETSTELIAGGSFLTSQDFARADHHFSGKFDKYGQFEGDVRIYDQAPSHHVIPWEEGKGVPTFCGPFSINFAHLQGEARNSRLAGNEYAVLKQKLDRFGGLYVYRDGIRILPYGNSDQDWLNVETRRNKGQAYYFFAYRRIFGAVEITQEDNAALVEKAGREGFQTNKAYRQFTSILENFFIQLAADFFRESGEKSSIWFDRKQELERTELARRKREENISVRKKAFTESLERFFARVEEDEPKTELKKLLIDVQGSLKSVQKEKDLDRAAELLIETESFAEHRLGELRKEFSIARPREIGLSTQVKRDWESYLIERAQLEEEAFAPASENLRALVGTAAKAAQVHVDQRKRLQTLISELSTEVTKSIQTQATDTRRIAEDRESEVRHLAQGAIVEMKDTIDGVRAELQRINFSDLAPNAVEQFRKQLQGKIDQVASRQRELLENAKQQLVEMRVGGEAGGEIVLSSGEITGAIEEEVLALRESADADAELVQLGMALAVVTHEFDAVIRSIRGELGRLKRWAQASPQLMPIYQRINGNFEHLDGYLALFTPLQRRLYRKPQSISGSEIAKFLSELFDERMKRHAITLVSTDEFCRKTVIGYPSTFFPVFVNLVDNAIYWLKNHRQPRTITLDNDAEGMMVANNGPKIPARDREAIFDLRFTRKPSGRGLGLYISRNTLAKAGYSLTLARIPPFSVCFRIAPQPGHKGGVDDES